MKSIKSRIEKLEKAAAKVKPSIDIDRLLGDILNRLAFDNEFIGRKNDYLYKEVFELRKKFNDRTPEN